MKKYHFASRNVRAASRSTGVIFCAAYAHAHMYVGVCICTYSHTAFSRTAKSEPLWWPSSILPTAPEKVLLPSSPFWWKKRSTMVRKTSLKHQSEGIHEARQVFWSPENHGEQPRHRLKGHLDDQVLHPWALPSTSSFSARQVSVTS